jgi:hypothetical protein
MNLEEMLHLLRGAQWMVAVHNDYRLNGNLMTFWLFTHPCGRFIKGEGNSDTEAVTQAFGFSGIPVPSSNRGPSFPSTNAGTLAEFDAIALKVRDTMSR